MPRGFGVAAGLDPEVARPLAARCAELGYASMWSNDHPGAKGLETLAEFAAGAPDLELGVGVIALDRTPPEAIAADVERVGVDPAKLWLGVGAGFAEKPLSAMRESLPELREKLPGVRQPLDGRHEHIRHEDPGAQDACRGQPSSSALSVCRNLAAVAPSATR